MAVRKSKGKPGRPKAESLKPSSISLRGSAEWREWLNEYAGFMSMPASVAIVQALRAQAKANGFDKPMPPR